MPKDAKLARELASTLNAEYTGKVREIKFTYDSYIELDDLPRNGDPVVLLTLEDSPLIREGRGVSRRDASIRLTMITAVGPTDDDAWIDQYIDSFDMLVELAMKTLVLGCLPVDMESEDRYDVDRFHTHRRLVMDVLINYRNL